MTIFLISMASLGLIAIPTIIMFCCVCCDSATEKIWCTIIIIIIWLLLGTAMSGDTTQKIKDWNGGQCECGGDWKLVAASQSHRGITNKFYVCEDCDKEIKQ